MVTSDFLSEIERELGLLQVMNDALPTRQDRIVKRIREMKAAQQSVQRTATPAEKHQCSCDCPACYSCSYSD